MQILFLDAATRHLGLEAYDSVIRLRQSDCGPARHRWSYSSVVRPYDVAAMEAVFGEAPGWTNTTFFSTASDTIDVAEEYVVYDASGILAALGGSLGLFLGFSFFDCGAAVLRNLDRGSKKVVTRMSTRKGGGAARREGREGSKRCCCCDCCHREKEALIRA